MIGCALLAVLAHWAQVTPAAGDFPVDPYAVGKYGIPSDTMLTWNHGVASNVVKVIEADVLRGFGYGPAVDVNHGSLLDSARGQVVGNVTGAYVMTNGAIAARLVLTDEGEKAWRSGRYTHFSPAFTTRVVNGVHNPRPVQLLSVAIAVPPVGFPELVLRSIRDEEVEYDGFSWRTVSR